MRKVSDQRLSDAVAKIVSVSISSHIGERQYGNRINLGCPARPHVPSTTCRHSDSDDTGSDDPECATFEFVRRCVRGSDFATLSVPFQTLEISLNFGCMLVANITIFLQSLADDVFELRRHVRIQSDY